jgi:hypothetical protein
MLKELPPEMIAKLEEQVAEAEVKMFEVGRDALPEALRADIYCEAILRACAKMVVMSGEAQSLHMMQHCEDNYEWSSQRRRKWAEDLRSKRGDKS